MIMSSKLEEEATVLRLPESSENISEYYQSVQIGAGMTAINQERLDDTFFQSLNEPAQQRLQSLVIGAVNLNISQPLIMTGELGVAKRKLLTRTLQYLLLVLALANLFPNIALTIEGIFIQIIPLLFTIGRII